MNRRRFALRIRLLKADGELARAQRDHLRCILQGASAETTEWYSQKVDRLGQTARRLYKALDALIEQQKRPVERRDQGTRADSYKHLGGPHLAGA